MDRSVAKETIKSVLKGLSAQNISEDTQILTDVFWDSVDLFNFVMDIEEEFKISIPPESVNDVVFNSLEAITDLVLSLQSHKE